MKYIYIAVLVCGSLALQGQQEIILSKYHMNQMLFNPAVAGSEGKGKGSVTFNYRDQWLGLDGSPKTYLFNGEVNAFEDKIGLGLSLGRESIGIDSRTDISGSVTYRIALEKGHINGGLKFGFQNFRSAFNEINYSGFQDVVYDQAQTGLNLFSVGFGTYYQNERVNIGFAVPAIATLGTQSEGLKTRHFYLHGSALFDMGEYSSIQLEPSFLVKYEKAAPLQYTFGSKLWLTKDFNVSGFSRSGDAFILGADFVFNEDIIFGLAYDFNTSELRDENHGSMEFFLSYTFSYVDYENPFRKK